MAELRGSPSPRRINVVVADDDGTFVEFLRAVVAEQPSMSIVGVAGDGLAAMELVEELEPEALLIDLHMPLLDGVSTVARMRRDHPSLCLIAMTADRTPELHQAVEEAGADVVVMKDELVAGLGDHMAAAASRLSAR